MSQDAQGPRLRERVWLEKWDKTVDPPVLVERVFVENGQIIEREVFRLDERGDGTWVPHA